MIRKCFRDRFAQDHRTVKSIVSWQHDGQRLPRKTLDMKHVLSALVVNQPGVLAHISGMLASRAYNIDSLAVGATENPDFSRITFVVNGDEKTLDQVRKQLGKIITVVKVQDFSGRDFVERDLMLIKVSTENGRRGEIRELVDIFRGRIVDVGASHVMIEISGRENKIEAFIERDVARLGRLLELRARGAAARQLLERRPELHLARPLQRDVAAFDVQRGARRGEQHVVRCVDAHHRRRAAYLHALARREFCRRALALHAHAAAGGVQLDPGLGVGLVRVLRLAVGEQHHAVLDR